MLNNIVDNHEQCGGKILFNAVFIRPEQVVHFWLCNRLDEIDKFDATC